MSAPSQKTEAAHGEGSWAASSGERESETIVAINPIAAAADDDDDGDQP